MKDLKGVERVIATVSESINMNNIHSEEEVEEMWQHKMLYRQKPF